MPPAMLTCSMRTSPVGLSAPTTTSASLMYDEVPARVSRYNSLSETLGSNGGVYNSKYIFPNIRYNLNDKWQVIGAFLMAWPDQPDGDTIRCSRDDASARCQENVERASEDDIATASHLGWEVDMALKGKFAGKMGLSLEAGSQHHRPYTSRKGGTAGGRPDVHRAIKTVIRFEPLSRIWEEVYVSTTFNRLVLTFSSRLHQRR